MVLNNPNLRFLKFCNGKMLVIAMKEITLLNLTLVHIFNILIYVTQLLVSKPISDILFLFIGAGESGKSTIVKQMK